jgi:hypothetical protein
MDRVLLNASKPSQVCGSGLVSADTLRVIPWRLWASPPRSKLV